MHSIIVDIVSRLTKSICANRFCMSLSFNIFNTYHYQQTCERVKNAYDSNEMSWDNDSIICVRETLIVSFRKLLHRQKIVYFVIYVEIKIKYFRNFLFCSKIIFQFIKICCLDFKILFQLSVSIQRQHVHSRSCVSSNNSYTNC